MHLVHRPASAQGSCCPTNVISTVMHTVIVITSELVNYIARVSSVFLFILFFIISWTVWGWVDHTKLSLLSVTLMFSLITFLRIRWSNWIFSSITKSFDYEIEFYTLSGRTGSALVWYSEGRRFAPHSAVSLVNCRPARIAVCIRGAQGVLPCVGWWVQPVNWIYRLWRHCP